MLQRCPDRHFYTGKEKNLLYLVAYLQEGTTHFRICHHKVCQVSSHATTLKIVPFLRELGILLWPVQWLVETDVWSFTQQWTTWKSKMLHIFFFLICSLKKKMFWKHLVKCEQTNDFNIIKLRVFLCVLLWLFSVKAHTLHEKITANWI